jgi:hypothetical protein
MELQRGPEDDVRIRQPRAQEMLRTLDDAELELYVQERVLTPTVKSAVSMHISVQDVVVTPHRVAVTGSASAASLR